jgi:fatty-acyl-CoA synthase
MNWSSRTIGGLMDEVCAGRGDAVAVVHGEQRLSYRELQELGRSAARALVALGVRHGHRVAGLISNRPEWIVTMLAAARIGATYVPLNTWYRPDELSWTMLHTGAVALIAEPTFLKRDYAADITSIDPGIAGGTPGDLHLDTMTALRAVVYLGAGRPGAFGWEEFLALGAGVSDEMLATAEAAADPDDPLFILYTSGSTAEPKGVVLRHRGIIENGWGIGERRGIDSADRIWLGSPLFYGLGAANCLPAWLTHGATLVLQGHFVAATAIDVIEREQCTVFYGMSNMIRMIYEDPAYARERVRSLTKGAAGISVAERKILIEDMGVSGATASYGATELYGNCFGGLPDDPLAMKYETCGSPLPGFEFRVVDPDTFEDLPQGEVGLLLVRGHVTDTYFGNPDEIRSAFVDGGFYNTGDLGAFDDAGYFRYSSRQKEMIKVGGINVSPVEVEQILLRHPQIREASVVGVPDAVRGEAMVAVLAVSGAIAAEDVRAYMRDTAASFKTPTEVLIRPDGWVPRTASGKVAKQVLKLRWTAATARPRDRCGIARSLATRLRPTCVS